MSRPDGIELLAGAHDHLLAVVRGVSQEGWERPTPCTGWTARQVLNHARLDQQAYEAALTGTGGPDADPFQPVDSFAADPVHELEDVLRRVAAAWDSVADADSVTTPLPVGPLPLWVAAGACAVDAAVHAWDISKATGQDLPIPVPIARDLLAVSGQPWVEQLRAFAFAPVVPTPPGEPEDAARALLRHLGRDPDWTPPDH